MKEIKRFLPFILLAAMLVFAGLVMAGEEAEDSHPDVDLNIPCDVCHAEITPKVVKQWYAGPHGEFNVKCFVCHGSIGSDFTMKPDAMRCVGCHADQVATMDSPMMSGNTCFTCHHQHRLNPNLAMAKTGEGDLK